MPSARALLWLERLVWMLIYGGLFASVIGIAVRDSDAALGWSLIVVGALVAAAGALLIWIRSRLQERE